MTELSNVIDKFGVYIYKNPLIYFRIENFGSWKHREVAMQKDPNANTYICKLDEEILSEYPIFTPDYLTVPKDEEENSEYDKTMLKEWIYEGYSDLLIAMMNAARGHRWCIVKLYDRAPFWRVFTWRELKIMNYNKYDIPVSADVEWSYPLIGNQEIKMHKERVNFNKDDDKTDKFDGLFVTFGNPNGNKVGINDLESIWDLIVYARYQMLDIINNSAKTSGFYHIVYGDGIKPKQITDLKKSFDYTGIGQAVGAKEMILKDIKFHAPDHPEFTVEALNKTINLLAGTCRLPSSFFMGEKDGGGVFQEGFSDEAKISKKKKYIFGQFKKYIIQLVKMRWGKDVEDVVPYIEEQVKEDEQFEQEASKQFESDHFNNKKSKEVKDKV